MSNVATLRAGGHLSPIVPQTIEDVYRLATMAFRSGMLKPLKSGFGENAQTEDTEATLARGTMIIMQGMEIGVPPMQSIQLLAMINGRIAAHSEAVPGIIWARGFKIREWFTGTEMADDWTAHCEITRPDGDKITGKFSVADAKRAGLWDQSPTKVSFGKTKPNDSAWFRYPQRMLKARALGFAGKDGAADALKGIQIREEAEDMAPREIRDVTPAKVPALELPDIPDEAPSTETAEARKAIAECINAEMLSHLREAYPEADWENLAGEYDAKFEQLKAQAAE
jgi:hypothetical protein